VVGFGRFMVLGSGGIHPPDRFLKGFARFPPLWPAFASPTRSSVEHDVGPTQSVRPPGPAVRLGGLGRTDLACRGQPACQSLIVTAGSRARADTADSGLRLRLPSRSPDTAGRDA
jgi:hypothetical protein